MRKPSGDHSIPCGASAVKPGSVKMAEIVSGFVCACKVAGAIETRKQRAKARKQKQEGTKTTPTAEINSYGRKRRISVQERHFRQQHGSVYNDLDSTHCDGP